MLKLIVISSSNKAAEDLESSLNVSSDMTQQDLEELSDEAEKSGKNLEKSNEGTYFSSQTIP